MSGGYGKTRWGRGSWGSAEHQTSGIIPVDLFQPGIYPIPFNQFFGGIPNDRFTGEPLTGPLSGGQGLIFFSVSLLQPSSGNAASFAFVSIGTFSADVYSRPPERSSRLFKFGGGPGFGSTNLSRTNMDLYRSQPLEYTAVATLIQTIPPGPTTVIKIP